MSQNRDLYGSEPPTRLSRVTRILGGLATLVLFAALTQAVLVHFWGPPPGMTPWVSHPLMRVLGWSVAGLGCLALVYRGWRTAGVVLSVTGIVLSLAPLHSFALTWRVLWAGTTEVLIAAGFALGLSVTCVALVGRRMRLKRASVKGSTTWGGGKPLRKAGKGVLLGRDNMGRLLRYDGDGHLITVAATRGGKGVGAIIPNLINHPGSVVCTDPKGENYFVTARHRASMPGHRVVALDPFGVTKTKTGGWNPLDAIDLEDPSYLEVATSIAENILGKPEKGQVFWTEEAKRAMVTFLLYVKSLEPEDRNLTKARSLMSLPGPMFEELLTADMGRHELKAVRDGAAMLCRKPPRELGGVMSTLSSKTHVFESPRLETVLTERSFTRADLVGGKVSVYLIVPQEHLRAYAPWLRLMVASLYTTITRGAHLQSPPKERILFMLDEFANMGRLPAVENALTFGAGFGITVWVVLQDLAQLKMHYQAAADTFLANCTVLQLFALQDPHTCDLVSKMLGDATVWQRDVRREGGKKHGRVMQEYKEEARRLLKPEELRRLDERLQILLVRPLQPVVARKLCYYKDRLFRGQWAPNPYIRQ